MAIRKKSLIGSRPVSTKESKPVQETAAIGESKPLTANALRAKAARILYAKVKK
jgi:hypothetical protein